MKRLTVMQKRQAIFTVLTNTPFALTANTIGKKIGLSTGNPLHSILCEMEQRGELVFTEDLLQTKTKIYLWRLTEKGRQAAWNEFEVRLMDSISWLK